METLSFSKLKEQYIISKLFQALKFVIEKPIEEIWINTR